jgi:hypothetical protein
MPRPFALLVCPVNPVGWGTGWRFRSDVTRQPVRSMVLKLPDETE